MLQLTGIQQHVILAPYTTYQIGGPADYFIEVSSAEALVEAVSAARLAKIPYFVLGCGANILVRDKGFRGLVIHNIAKNFEFLSNNQLVAESGAILADLIIACRDQGLSGLEHFVGIPSTVGGAMWQNLHFLAPDRTRTLYIEECIVKGRVLQSDGKITEVEKTFFQFDYDDSRLHHEEVIVLDVTFQLTPQPKSAIQTQMDANMAWRIAKQPQLWEYPSCGSVFKKIEGVGAGRLIDEAGLKGKQVGQAQISPKHANYIVNLGGAKAQDVLDIIALVQKKVAEKTGYKLEPEIRIIGEE